MDESERDSTLVEGKWYKVTLEDCCIEGVLYGMFLYKRYDDGCPIYHFSFGWLAPEWGKWTVEEL